jgi:plasmid stabilization system protein ParE
LPKTISTQPTDELTGSMSSSLLATQPLMGRARDELASGIRSSPFGRYVIFYAPIHDGIDVVRVLHSDIDAQLDKPAQ